MKVTVVCEHNSNMDSAEGKAAYPEGMGKCLAELFAEGGSDVQLLRSDEASVHGLTDEVLEGTDVLVWWGHIFHTAVPDGLVEKIAYRVQRGMGLICLHSAHDSKIFKRLMGTTCSLTWREAGETERLWCTDPSHPIARGLGEYVTVPHEEMYGEPFDIPAPDELIFLGWFKGGEALRAGCVFRRGRGKVFYLNAGHETYPTYKIPEIRQILRQACAYVAPEEGVLAWLGCKDRKEFLGK